LKTAPATKMQVKILLPNQPATLFCDLSHKERINPSYFLGDNKPITRSTPFSSRDRKRAMARMNIVEPIPPKKIAKALRISEEAFSNVAPKATVKLSILSKASIPNSSKGGASLSKY